MRNKISNETPLDLIDNTAQIADNKLRQAATLHYLRSTAQRACGHV